MVVIAQDGGKTVADFRTVQQIMASMPLILGKLASGFLDITIHIAKCTILRWLLSSVAKVAEALELPAGIE